MGHVFNGAGLLRITMRHLLFALLLCTCAKKVQPPTPPKQEAPTTMASPDGAILVECPAGQKPVILHRADGALLPGCEK